MPEEHQFLLQRVQPAMVGLIDGSLSTLAPIFGIALATHKPLFAFVAGLVTAIGAGISMGFSQGLSDTGQLTGPRRPGAGRGWRSGSSRRAGRRSAARRRRTGGERPPASAAAPSPDAAHGDRRAGRA